MRESLKKSIADSPAQGFERYPKGSIVICNACAKPILKLDRGIALGDKMGQMASAFKPLGLTDLDELAARTDVDGGLRAEVAAWTPEQRKEHLAKLHEFHTGDPALCPACGNGFLQVVAVEKNEVLDKAYTVEMLTVPPFGMQPVPIRGKHVGAGPGKDWVH